MPTPQEPDRPAPAEPGRDALERLYVYWLVSTALLLLVLVAVVVMTRGALQRQNTALVEVRDRLAALETRAARPAPAIAPAGSGPAPARDSEAPLEAGPPAPRRDPATAPALESPAIPPAETPVGTRPAVVARPPTQAEIRTALAAVLDAEARSAKNVVDHRQAAALLAQSQTHLAQADWDAPTWEDLAVLARLLERHGLSERFAARAAEQGAALTRFAEVSARVLLAAGRPRDALPFVEQYAESSDGAPNAPVLLAAVLLAGDDPAGADEVLQLAPAPQALEVADRLLAARIYFALERWPALERILDTLPEAPASHETEHGFLTAVRLARGGRTVEALAILDGLLADAPASAAAEGPDEGGGASPAPAEPRGPGEFPDAYELAVWRGVTLMHAQQPDAARQALQAAAERDPGRPTAHYYLGVLEARAGRPELAETHLKNALASSARLAQAWEALAVLGLERDQLDTALEYLREALAANPRRASAHYLAALVYARRAQKDPATRALQAALQLDPAYLEEARHAAALTALFSAEEMESWAAPAAPDGVSSKPAPATGPGGP